VERSNAPISTMVFVDVDLDAFILQRPCICIFVLIDCNDEIVDGGETGDDERLGTPWMKVYLRAQVLLLWGLCVPPLSSLPSPREPSRLFRTLAFVAAPLGELVVRAFRLMPVRSSHLDAQEPTFVHTLYCGGRSRKC
jgi:hypothetical protein